MCRRWGNDRHEHELVSGRRGQTWQLVREPGYVDLTNARRTWGLIVGQVDTVRASDPSIPALDVDERRATVPARTTRSRRVRDAVELPDASNGEPAGEGVDVATVPWMYVSLPPGRKG